AKGMLIMIHPKSDYLRSLFLLFFLVLPVFSIAVEQWSRVYTTIFTDAERKSHGEKQTYTFVKERSEPFTQLIFSWNAHRPQKGYFSFWVQGCDSETRKWGSWHKMIEWGDGVQRSFLSDSDELSRHFHVRFEAQSGKKMNGFR